MLTRRRFLGALGLAPLAGCGRGGSSTTVRFWNGFTGPDGRTMLKLVRRFNRENPDITVLMQRMDWGTYYNKLFVGGLGGRAPEVFVLHTRALLRFARAGFAAPLDPILGDFPASTDLDANVWEAAKVEGSHYGLPLDVHAMGMYYNKKLFRDSGLDPEKPPTNRVEFLEAMRRIKKPGKNGEPDQWGYVFTNFETCTYTFLKQFGGSPFTPDYSRCTLNSPENIAALAFCRSLIKEGLVPSPENIDSWIGFRQGRIGMVFEGIYMLADLQKQKDLDFAGAPVPQVTNHSAVWADSHNLCLKAGLTPEKQRAAWRFMRFLSDNSVDWAAGGQIPTRPSLRATPEFQAMAVQSAFAKQIPFVQYQPRLPFIFEYQTEYGLAVEKILRGKASPEEALAAAEKRVNEIIKREATP
ncbi:ABC transporter substrate-binding protein [Armatimonas sp.]|uniref:ABC transporter substrate-binding protein n=1 Tax=Armatimonas sp. TaxID=1872638 RepID=UPI00286C7422|nr:ABC transporter substrate-binding protein [Armatimonas sp.]